MTTKNNDLWALPFRLHNEKSNYIYSEYIGVYRFQEFSNAQGSGLYNEASGLVELRNISVFATKRLRAQETQTRRRQWL